MTDVEALDFVLHASDLLVASASARRFDPHMHDTWSVIIVTKGAATFRSRRWSAVARAGDMLAFRPYEVHAGVCLTEAVEYRVVYPSRRFMADHLTAASVPLLGSGALPRIAASEGLLDALIPTTPDAVRLEEALRRVLEGCVVSPMPSHEGTVASIAEARRLIESIDHASIRTATLAQAVGLHPSHFVRAFHRDAGLAPQTYVRQVRVGRARALICAGMTLSEAALAAGFCDQAHLTREFRKVFGVTPGRLSRSAHAKSIQDRVLPGM